MNCPGVLNFLFLGWLMTGVVLPAWGDEGLSPEPIYRLQSAEGVETYSTFLADNLQADPMPAFFAITTPDRPIGLPPVFAISRKGGPELTRLPPRGQENFSEPLFFALPAGCETNHPMIAGNWRITARHHEGHTDEFRWELASLGERVAGRFDPNTDYRFAFITGGTWRTNTLHLAVDYINETFELTGRLVDGQLSGEWTRGDGGDGGVWTAVGLGSATVFEWSDWKRVPLFEWKHPDLGRRVWRVETDSLPKPWLRQELPLCDVWIRR